MQKEHEKTTEDLFAEIVARVEQTLETSDYESQFVKVSHHDLAIMRSIQSRLARLQREAEYKDRAIRYLQEGGWSWSVEA